MGCAARFASYRSYRDLASKEFVASLGIDVAGDEVYPDIVFSLNTPESNAGAKRSDRLTVGIGVMSYYGWQPGAESGKTTYERYLAKLTRFAIWLLERGYRVRLLIGSQADTPVVRSVIERVTAQTDLRDDALVSEPAETLHDLIVQMRDTDVVIATRFHNVVAALKCGKPVLSLGYADKNMHLLKEFGLEQFSQPVDSIDFDLLIRQFEEIMVERRQIGPKIEDGVDRLRQSLQRQEGRLFADIIPSASA
jgi:polysaccharide pyruvyl transferase WcaK-like protein